MPVPGAIAHLTIFALGCVVGSFLNVCIYRLPSERSVVHPPSHCPRCGARLHPAELIPLFSYLALGRKCRHCGGPISPRYFGVELLTGLTFVGVAWSCQLDPCLIPYWIFAGAMIAVVFADLDHLVIPDQLVLAALAAALLAEAILVASGRLALLSVTVPGVAFAVPRLLAGAVVGLGVFFFIRGFSQLLFRREGMGLGDVKLAGAIGAMLGPGLALLSFGMAVAAGAALGLGLILLRLRRRMEYLPFGPFLAAAALVVLLAPGAVSQAAAATYQGYLSLFGL